MAAVQRDTIYIDVDDEITSIIEKVQDSPGKVVALVLPKRATTLQSVVNMKLLKRSATEAKKHLVLITSEAGLLPLAGAVGLHVSKTLQSKPEVPEAPVVSDAPISVDDPDDAALDYSAPVGQLAGPAEPEEEESIEVDNDTPLEVGDDTPEPKVQKPAGKKSASKGFKIPDFNKFRVRVVLAVLVVALLVVGWVVAYVVLPKAQIVIKTNNVNVTSSLTLTASPAAKSVDATKMIVPAEAKQLKKSDTQQVTATGQRDEGTKASGTITLTNCINDGQSHTVPSGTTMTSGQFQFVTTADVTLDPALFSGPTCKSATFGLSKDVAVTAAQAGDSYNLSPRSYTGSISGIDGYGSAMKGGTSKIVTIVSQSDIDGAKQKILDANSPTVTQTMVAQLKTDGYVALSETMVAGAPLVTASPNVGDPAANVTVTVAVTYTMTGVQQAGIKQLLDADINKHIDVSAQKILDDGLDKATIRMTTKAPSGDVALTVQSAAVAGVQQDVNDIKKAVAGKKRGDVQSQLLARPGVKDVTVTYSPFWVYSTPKSANKITVIFQQ
jgi:hypothetical protein